MPAIDHFYDYCTDFSKLVIPAIQVSGGQLSSFVIYREVLFSLVLREI